MKYICNAFSLGMLPEGESNLRVSPLTLEEAGAIVAPWEHHRGHQGGEGALTRSLEAVSAIGHADTAALLSGLLGISVPMARITVALRPGDTAIVAQLSGPRLPEGATTLPEGASIRWLRVEIIVVSSGNCKF